MKRFSRTVERPVFVAIDIAKARHHVLIEFSNGKRTKLSVANTLTDFNKLADQLAAASPCCEVGARANWRLPPPASKLLSTTRPQRAVRVVDRDTSYARSAI